MKTLKIKKNRKTLFYICTGFFFGSFLIAIFLCIMFTPKIYLEERKIVINYLDEVKMPNYHAYLGNKDVSDDVEIIGQVDNKKVGSYWVEYHLNSFFFPVRELVLVEVMEKVAPEIRLEGSSEVILCPNETYQELGYEAIDNYDGNITDNVEISVEENLIRYQVRDSSGNYNEMVRHLKYDDVEMPILELNGDSRVILYLNETYHELGYQVSDNCDEKITEKVQVSGSVDTSHTGTYLVHYEVTDNSGNFVSKTRTVEVISKPKKEEKGGVGEIYLTFDDGPSHSITPTLLDILKSEGVEATFFVIHHDSGLYKLIRREYEEGHTVALHSYTHNYGQIYRSRDAYFADLKQLEDEISSIIGESSNIIRFPGGSSNTVSRNYQRGIMRLLTKEVLEKGYRYFDWNVSSGDAGDVHSSEEVYRNVINGLSKSKMNVVLMHDFENNYYTLNAIRDIIRYGKENGYVFKKITSSTPMVHHKVVN